MCVFEKSSIDCVPPCVPVLPDRIGRGAIEIEKKTQKKMINTQFLVGSGVLSGIVCKMVLNGRIGVVEVLVLMVCLAVVIPEILIRLRFFAFLSLNVDESIELPTKNIVGEKYRWLYNHNDVSVRSIQKSYGLSDLFWYLLAPAHAIHQEHTEQEDVRYEITSRLTRKICSVSKTKLRELSKKYVEPVLSGQHLTSMDRERRGNILRLREVFFPIFERVMFELVFQKELPEELNRVLCASAENVIEALKGMLSSHLLTHSHSHSITHTHNSSGGVLRDMDKRNALTIEIERLLIKNQKTLQLDPRLPSKEWALFLQGVVFTTAVVQLSEGAAHIGVALAQNRHVLDQVRAAKDKNLPYYIVDEVLRLWPLFGDAHRMAKNDISIPDAKKGDIQTIKKGTVLIFNYPEFHASETKWDDLNTFNPSRWKTISRKRDLNYIPFGVANNRPCPGARLSRHLLASVVEEIASSCEISSVVTHTRSLPCGGIATLKPRGDRTYSSLSLSLYLSQTTHTSQIHLSGCLCSCTVTS